MKTSNQRPARMSLYLAPGLDKRLRAVAEYDGEKFQHIVSLAIRMYVERREKQIAALPRSSR